MTTLLLIWYALFWATLGMARPERPTRGEMLSHLILFPTLPLWFVADRLGLVFEDDPRGLAVLTLQGNQAADGVQQVRGFR